MNLTIHIHDAKALVYMVNDVIELIEANEEEDAYDNLLALREWLHGKFRIEEEK